MEFIYSYLAGTKTIDGFFPVYSSENLACEQKIEVAIPDTHSQTSERYPYVLYSAESSNTDTETILISVPEVDPDNDFEVVL